MSSGLSDNNLKTLFGELPQHCVVLLEDVGAASSKRTGDTNSSQNGSVTTPQKPVNTCRLSPMSSTVSDHQKAEC